jgi:hypothetical protein
MDFLDMGSTNDVITSGKTNLPMINAVLHLATAKEIQYQDLMKHSTLGPLYKKRLGNDGVRLYQGI